MDGTLQIITQPSLTNLLAFISRFKLNYAGEMQSYSRGPTDTVTVLTVVCRNHSCFKLSVNTKLCTVLEFDRISLGRKSLALE